MPNIISHAIYAEEVYKQIQDKDLKESIKKHLNEYYIGCNGPDFLFFYGFTLKGKHSLKYKRIASYFHLNDVNKFYETALLKYHTLEDTSFKEAMKVYIVAHYLHWQLDSTMHPYVYYKCGFSSKRNSFYHHKFESMMDTIFLKYYRNKTIKDFKTYDICKQSLFTSEVIYQIYKECIYTSLHTNIQKEDICQSLHDWKKVQEYLYDPTSIKYKYIRMLERISHIEFISGSIILTKEDDQHDIMNKNHNIWYHPVTKEMFTTSAYDLFNEAIEQTKIGIPLLLNALNNKEINEFLKYLNNRNYLDGLCGKNEKKYCDVIYE